MGMNKLPMALRQLVNQLIASLGFTPKNDEAEKIIEFAVACYNLGKQDGQHLQEGDF
jgi:hypothetical protein